MQLPNRIAKELQDKEKIVEFLAEHRFILIIFHEGEEYTTLEFVIPHYGSCLCKPDCSRCQCLVLSTLKSAPYCCTCLPLWKEVWDVLTFVQKSWERELYALVNGLPALEDQAVYIRYDIDVDIAILEFKKIEELEKNKVYTIDDYYMFTTKDSRLAIVLHLDNCRIYMPPRIVKKLDTIRKVREFFRNKHYFCFTGFSGGVYNYPLFDFPNIIQHKCLCTFSCTTCHCKVYNTLDLSECILNKVYNTVKYYNKIEEIEKKKERYFALP